MTGASCSEARVHRPIKSVQIAASAAVFLLAACAAETAKPEPDGMLHRQARNFERLVGHWYGEIRATDGSYRQWIIDRRPDGRFGIRFKTYKADCRLSAEQEEGGFWSASPQMYFTVTVHVKRSPTDVRDPYFNDAYKIDDLSDSEFRYTHIGYGIKFHQQKVAADFSFPGCST